MACQDCGALDEMYMQLALKEARRAEKIQEVPVGCVIVYKGRVIGKGYNRRNKDKSVLSHAELIAIKKACRRMGDFRLEGCTMYVTLEPCEMCAGAIVQARLDRVVFGTESPKAGSAGSVMNILSGNNFNHNVSVESGVLKDECSCIISDFFRKLRSTKAKKEK